MSTLVLFHSLLALRLLSCKAEYEATYNRIQLQEYTNATMMFKQILKAQNSRKVLNRIVDLTFGINAGENFEWSVAYDRLLRMK